MATRHASPRQCVRCGAIAAAATQVCDLCGTELVAAAAGLDVVRLSFVTMAGAFGYLALASALPPLLALGLYSVLFPIAAAVLAPRPVPSVIAVVTGLALAGAVFTLASPHRVKVAVGHLSTTEHWSLLWFGSHVVAGVVATIVVLVTARAHRALGYNE